MPRKVSLHDLQRKSDQGQPITMLTAYDYPAARLVDEAGVAAILVGDTLAMTVLGHRDTCRAIPPTAPACEATR